MWGRYKSRYKGPHLEAVQFELALPTQDALQLLFPSKENQEIGERHPGNQPNMVRQESARHALPIDEA